MHKWWWLVVIFVLWAGAGLGLFAGAGKARSVGDLQPQSVQRIVSAAPNLTEILFAIGLEKEIVAVSNDSDWPPEAREKRKTGSFWQPNVEAVIATRPDVVVTLGFSQQKALARRLDRMGYKSVTVDIESVDRLFAAIERIGDVTGRKEQAEKLARGLRVKLENLRRLTAGAYRPKVLYVVQREPLRVAGRGTFINELLEFAGGENAIGPTVHKYPPIGAEQVLFCGADVIIEPAMGREGLDEQRRSAVEYWKRFANVPAVKNGRIYVIPPDTVSRLGPRLYDGAEMIARCVRPELFGE